MENSNDMRRYEAILHKAEMDKQARDMARAKLEIHMAELKKMGIHSKNESLAAITEGDKKIRENNKKFNSLLSAFERKYASRLQKID